MSKLSDFISQEQLEGIKEELPEDEFENSVEDIDFLPNDGSYIPKERLDTKNSKIEALEEQRENLESQLESLKEDTETTEELQEKIESLQEENETIKEQKDQEIEQNTKRLRTKLKLKEHGARNPDAVTPFLDLDEIKLEENGDVVEVEGLEDQLEDIKESEDYLFETEEEDGDDTPGKSGGEFEGGTQPPSENPFAQDNLDLQRQGDLIQENPQRAKQMIKDAGKNPADFNLE